MKSILGVLVFTFSVASVLCWLGAFLLSFGITNNLRPEVRVWKDLGGNSLNAIFSKKFLTARGVKIRYYLFICTLGFCGCIGAAAVLAFLRSLL
jgi:hypothetical protein